MSSCTDDLPAYLMFRQLKGGDNEAEATKHALWRELAEAGFARTASAILLLPLLQLLLRVQLNILGRQLFMESNLLEPRCCPAWATDYQECLPSLLQFSKI